jgi:hypothetical protein
MKNNFMNQMSPRIDLDILLQTLAGYAEANAVAEAERRARLQTMTEPQARAIFNDLCATWYRQVMDGGDWERFDQWRIQHKIVLRQALDRLAGSGQR